MRFNLLVSTYRFREDDACDEILDLLGRFGDHDAEAEPTHVSGLVLAFTAIDPLLVVEKLKALVAQEPWEVRYILRVLPVERVVPAELEDIQGAARELALRIGPQESFRVTVEKRHSPLHSREVIDYVADVVDRKVDLDNPDWTILVEIVGRDAGVSVLKKGQVFSAVLEKRGEA
jgi:tRNA acetyltransferase TAN1